MTGVKDSTEALSKAWLDEDVIKGTGWSGSQARLTYPLAREYQDSGRSETDTQKRPDKHGLTDGTAPPNTRLPESPGSCCPPVAIRGVRKVTKQ